jgi:hypothetical protein
MQKCKSFQKQLGRHPHNKSLERILVRTMVAIRIANNDVVVVRIKLLPTIRSSDLQRTLPVDIISVACKIIATRSNGIIILFLWQVSKD